MARPRRRDMKAVARARKAVAKAGSMEELRAAQAVLFPAVMNTTLTETAALLGVGRRRSRGCSPSSDKARNASSSWRRAAKLGRATQCAADLGGRRRVSGSVAGTGQRRWTTGSFPVASGFGGKTGSTRESLGGVSTAGPSRLAEGGTGHPSSQKRSGSTVRVKKNSPKRWQHYLKPEEVRDRRVRLMFQDEAWFGRMVRIRRCWAPTPERPVVNNGYERQFVYVYGGVSRT